MTWHGGTSGRAKERTGRRKEGGAVDGSTVAWVVIRVYWPGKNNAPKSIPASAPTTSTGKDNNSPGDPKPFRDDNAVTKSMDARGCLDLSETVDLYTADRKRNGMVDWVTEYAGESNSGGEDVLLALVLTADGRCSSARFPCGL